MHMTETTFLNPALSVAGWACAMALASMMAARCAKRKTPSGYQPPTGQPHFAPKAKSVIWLFMNGGVSHMESFDPSPC